VKKDLYLQKLLKLIAIPNFKNTIKKTVVVKMKMKKISIMYSKRKKIDKEKNLKKVKKKIEKTKGFANPFTCQSHIFDIRPLNWTPSL